MNSLKSLFLKRCNEIHNVIIPPILDPMSTIYYTSGLPIAFETATKEHAGDSGVQLSVGAEIEAYGDQASSYK